MSADRPFSFADRTATRVVGARHRRQVAPFALAALLAVADSAWAEEAAAALELQADGASGSSGTQSVAGETSALREDAGGSPAPATTPAAPAADASGSAIRLGPVEVRGEEVVPPPEPTVAEEPTGFGTTIETSELAARHRDVGDLLLLTPGSRVHKAPGGATLMLRGGSADQSLVLLDGIPLNAASGGGVDLRTIPASLLERVTVLRGNEGARWGSGALGGVALLETRRLRSGLGGSLELQAGSFGTAQFDGTLFGGDDETMGLAALTLRRSDGNFLALHDPTPLFNPGDARRQELANNDERGGGLLLKGSRDLGGATLHGLLHGWLAERGLPGTFYTPDDHRRAERRLIGALRIEGAPSASLQLDGGFDLRHDEVAVWSDTVRGTTGAQPRTDQAGRPWQVENALTLRAGAGWAPAEWTLLRGDLEIGGDWIDSPYHGSAHRQRLALAVGDEIYVGDRITVAPAIRWDRVGAHDGLSPRLGLAWRPAGPIELRANWGRSFRAPSFGELHLEQARIKPNPDLRPESGWTVDGGAVLRLPRAMVQVVAFYARIEDLILYEVVSGGVSKPFNFHDAEIRGGEAEALVRPLPWLALSGSYSLAKTRNLRDDPRFFHKELPFRPAHRVYGRIAASGDGMEAFVDAAWQSEQFLNRANSDQLPAWAAVGGGAAMRLARFPWELWLAARVDNAFDELRLDQLGFPQPGRAFTLSLRATSPEAGAFDDQEKIP